MYVAIVKNCIRAFLQMVAYYRYLKGGIRGLGLSKEELKLKYVQHRTEQNGNQGIFQKVLLDTFEADKFYTSKTYHKEAKLFGL